MDSNMNNSKRISGSSGEGCSDEMLAAVMTAAARREGFGNGPNAASATAESDVQSIPAFSLAGASAKAAGTGNNTSESNFAGANACTEEVPVLPDQQRQQRQNGGRQSSMFFSEIHQRAQQQQQRRQLQELRLRAVIRNSNPLLPFAQPLVNPMAFHLAQLEMLRLRSLLSILPPGIASAGGNGPPNSTPAAEDTTGNYLQSLQHNQARAAAPVGVGRTQLPYFFTDSYPLGNSAATSTTSSLLQGLGGAAAQATPFNPNAVMLNDPAATSGLNIGVQYQRQRGQIASNAEFMGPDVPPNRVLKLPPIQEGDTVHCSLRLVVPLGIEEDANFLSERQVYIRGELIEVIRASHAEVLVRSSSKSIGYQQVGIRCRYCAHLQPGSRAIRASAFPSSIRQMYQSFTMMVRDHFGDCVGVPQAKKAHFLKLKGLTSPSSSLSRQYWTYAAERLGMVDSENGIVINEATQAAAEKMPPFGTTLEETQSIKEAPTVSLVEPSELQSISPYLRLLMEHTQLVYLLPSERVGKRKDAATGLPGFGCRHCAKKGRLGFCRMFPLNKRSLPDKINDLHNHIKRCSMCPRADKLLLESRREEIEGNRNFAERDREFIDRLWSKLGRDADVASQKS